MSCETNKKKFASDLKNNILDANWKSLQVESKLNTNTAKPISYSDRQVVFIPFDANNPNTDVAFGKIKNLVSQINENYQNEFGVSNTASYNKMRDGYEISIHPSQKLIDAINIQFNNEELNTFNSRYQVKEGVEELFESNSELANIGTPEQYSEYLDTIFPDSKVKDIVYHGSRNKEAVLKEGFKKENKDDLIFFSPNKKQAFGENIIFAKLNLIKPAESLAEFNEFNEEYDIEGYINNPEISNRAVPNEVAVKHLNKIHILGSKQDIQGFK